MKNNLALVGIAFVLLFSVFSGSAAATGCSFNGSVKANYGDGYVSVDPALITAYLNDTISLTIEHLTQYEQNPGYYVIHVLGANNKNIKFKVHGEWAEQGEQLCNPLDHGDVDLTAIVPKCKSLDLGDPCSVGVGGCARSGVKICSADGLSTVCNATKGTPDAMETCGDGVDNDCDGAVDNGCGGGGGGGTGGGGAGAYCGDGILQKWTGEECEKDIACNSTSFACNLTSCKCICQENWSCGLWSDCSTGGVQTRTCADANACGTTLQKPSESQSCTYTSGGGSTQTPLTEIVCGDDVCDTGAGETCDNCADDCGACAGATTEGTGFNVLGMFIGTQGAGILGLILLIAIMLLLLMATKRKKKKK